MSQGTLYFFIWKYFLMKLNFSTFVNFFWVGSSHMATLGQKTLYQSGVVDLANKAFGTCNIWSQTSPHDHDHLPWPTPDLAGIIFGTCAHWDDYGSPASQQGLQVGLRRGGMFLRCKPRNKNTRVWEIKCRFSLTELSQQYHNKQPSMLYLHPIWCCEEEPGPCRN